MPNPMSDPSELKVFISSREGTCGECGAQLTRSAWICLDKVKGAVCLPCSDLDHLEFLPTGDAALTRRAKQASALWAVVLKWSRSRRRYERQGLLVEQAALETAETACIADAPERAARAHARAEAKSPVFDFAPITMKADDQCRISWQPAPEGKARFILAKSSVEAYRRAMPIALISLLKTLR